MSQQLQITGGAKVRSLEGVITGSTGVLGSLPINGANGIPQLDSNGKILVSQLPNSVMEYKGTWNVTTNTPYLVNGTGNTGDVYLVEGAATGGTSHDFGAGAITFYNGDQVIYSGSIWQRGAGSSGTVTSVAITESGDALTITGSPITNSGTINIGFAGTSAQYVAGNGALVTFPALTGYVPYTGATATLDMGSFDVNARGFKVNGTAGSGHVDFKHQSGTPTGSASSTTLYADTNGDIAWKNDHNYITTFDSHSNTADRIYTLPNASGTVALTSDLSAYVPTSRTLTINGVTYDLSANRSWTISTGISGSGTTNYIPKFTGSTSVGNSSLQELSAGWLQLGSSSINTSELDIVGNTGAKVFLYDGFGSATIQSYYNDAFTILTQVGGQTTNVMDYNYATKTLIFQTNGNNTRLNITSSGNIGIGNTNDTYKLDVTGTGRFSGQLTLGSTITNGTYTYTLPGATGTLALLSDIPSVSGYVPYTGAGSNVDLGDYTLSAANLYAKAHGSFGSAGQLYLGKGSAFAGVVGYSSIAADQYNKFLFITGGTTAGDAFFNFNNISVSTTRTYTFPNSDGTIALTTDLSSYVPTSRTLTINGTTYDLSANRSWTVSGSQWTTIGSDIYYNTGNVGINQSSPTYKLDVGGTGRFTGLISANAGIKAQYGRIDGRLFSTSDAEFGDMTSTTGCLSMSFDATGQQGYLTSRNYATATDKPLNYNGSSHIFNGGKVSISSLDGESFKLQLATSTGNNYLRFYSSAGSGLGYIGSFYNGSSQYLLVDGSGTDLSLNGNANLLLRTGGTERMRINSTGNVGIGTTSFPSFTGAIQLVVKGSSGNGTIQAVSADGGTSLTMYSGASSSDDPAIIFQKNLRFGSTTDTGLGGYTERMRITSGGQVLFGTTSSLAGSVPPIVTYGSSAGPTFVNASSGQQSLLLWNQGSTGNNIWTEFHTESSITFRGSIYFNRAAGIVVYGTSSDYRIKTEIEEFNALDIIKKLKPKKFKINEAEEKSYGFIAHELQEFVPQAVVGQKDEIKEDGTPKLQQVDYAQLTGLLTKAIQEQQAQIEELKAKLN